MTKHTFKGLVLYHAVMILIFGIMFVIGTFHDEEIAAAVYTPGNFIATAVTTVGIYPFFAAAVLFMGVLTERAVHSDIKKPLKIVYCVLCAALALYSGFKGSKTLMSVDCLGGIYPSLNRNMPVIICTSIAAAYPLFYIGFRIAAKNDDKLLAKKVLGLVITMIAALVTMEVLKDLFSRPRYRIAVRGYDGIGFVPWYSPFSGAADYVSALGLEKTDFRSFPSGHSVIGISCIYIFMSLAWLFPGLKGKQGMLCIFGSVFGIIVMFTRMLLGAHYLSDVSAGAAIGTLLSFVFILIQHNIIMKKYPALAEIQRYE